MRNYDAKTCKSLQSPVRVREMARIFSIKIYSTVFNTVIAHMVVTQIDCTFTNSTHRILTSFFVFLSIPFILTETLGKFVSFRL